MDNLLTSLKINRAKLKNRIVIPPLASQAASKFGIVTKNVLDQYRDRPNVGMVIVEHTYIRREGRVSEKQLGIYDESHVSGLGELARVIKGNGSIAAIQLTHGGSASSSHILGRSAFAPSEVKHPGRDIDEIPTKLTVEDLKELKHSFVKAALRAQKAGFNLIELHGAHGYLLNQFLSPLTNKRKDRYGGSLENRLRFPLEVIESIRGAVGSKYPLAYRLGCDDFLAGGINVEDAVEAAKHIEKAGIDLLDLSGGLTGYTGAGNEEGFFVYFGENIRPKVDIPVMVTGGITDPEYADRIVREGKTDLVGVGRAMLKDKKWAQKAVNTLKKNK